MRSRASAGCARRLAVAAIDIGAAVCLRTLRRLAFGQRGLSCSRRALRAARPLRTAARCTWTRALVRRLSLPVLVVAVRDRGILDPALVADTILRIGDLPVLYTA